MREQQETLEKEKAEREALAIEQAKNPAFAILFQKNLLEKKQGALTKEKEPTKPKSKSLRPGHRKEDKDCIIS